MVCGDHACATIGGFVAGCLSLEGLCDFKFTHSHAFILGIVWSALDIVGDVLFYLVELKPEAKLAELRESDGAGGWHVDPRHLQMVSFCSIASAVALFVWRFTYWGKLQQVGFNLTQGDDEEALMDDDEDDEISQGTMVVHNPMDKAATLGGARERKRRHCETCRCTEDQRRRSLRSESAVVDKKAKAEERQQNVAALVRKEKVYAVLTFFLEDLLQLLVSGYVALADGSIAEGIDPVMAFSVGGSLVAAMLVMYRAYSMGAYALAQSPEEKALRRLFKQLGGRKWRRQRNWREDTRKTPLGEWHGVKVNGDGKVVALDLKSNKLAGNFDTWADRNIGKFSQLALCNLGDNPKLESSLREVGALQKVPPGSDQQVFIKRSGAGVLKAAKFSAAELRVVGFSATELKAAEFKLPELKIAGFPATELKAAAFSLAELKAQLFSVRQLKVAEFSLRELKAGGFTAVQLRDGGFPVADLKAHFTAAELKGAGVSATALKGAGFSATALKEAGFSATELKEAGFSVRDLITQQEHALPVITFSVTELKAGGFTATELKAGGLSAAELREAGCLVKELKAGGFSAIELHDGGFSDKELKAGGFSKKERKFAAEVVQERQKIANVHPEDLSQPQATDSPEEEDEDFDEGEEYFNRSN
jgi:uncharacterized protein YjbI with pentapeptide repeats